MNNPTSTPLIGHAAIRKTVSALAIVCATSLLFTSAYAGTAVGNPGEKTAIGSSGTVKDGTAVGNPGRAKAGTAVGNPGR